MDLSVLRAVEEPGVEVDGSFHFGARVTTERCFFAAKLIALSVRCIEPQPVQFFTAALAILAGYAA